VKKVLIITYYWPPSGGAGVQRWLKFAKYLRESGWEPVIYTPENPELTYTDKSLLDDVPEGLTILKTKIFEPYNFYKLLTGKSKSAKYHHGFLQDSPDKSSTFMEKLAVWIRGNLFIPDARRWWIKPSVRFLKKYMAEHKPELIVSTGPPHSMHLIGMGLKQKFNIPWIADFRDPWTGIYYFEKLKLSERARKKHFKLEKACMDSADLLLTVGQTMKQDFGKITNTPVEVITNGYDHADYEQVIPQKAEKFSLMYTGMFLPDQNPPELWEVLQELVEEDEAFSNELQLRFIGKTDAAIVSDIKKNNLIDFLRLEDHFPHDELPYLQQQAAVLLLCINRIPNARYILTGKVFEYLASGKPILAICPEDSDVAKIIKDTQSGFIVPFGEKEKLKKTLSQLFDRFSKDGLAANTKGAEAFSRQELSRRLADIFNKLINNSIHK
jgi:glycosyltransferase involved in cell wall biosynthesis